MRIVSGIYGGRRLEVPKGKDIRPTSDKVRGAMFNALRSRMDLEGAVVLDCFAGTGALGLEALSNGAASCIFFDISRDSLALAKANAEVLGASDEACFVQRDASKMLPRKGDQAVADLVFLDPPYEKGLVVPTLQVLAEGDWLAAGAVLVIEAERDFVAILPKPYVLLDEKTYGDTKILYVSSPE